MQAVNQNATATESSHANGHSSLHDIFAVTDEQILEIEPEAQDVTVRDSGSGDSLAPAANGASQTESRSANRLDARDASAAAAPPQPRAAQAGVPVLLEPPAWLAETMNDPQRGAEARALWDGAQRAEREAASFREVFAKPEEARAAAERARVLDDIDRAYFAGDTSQRAQLAAMMMREDPAAFREMVFEGLRALEATEQPGRARTLADTFGRTPHSATGSSVGATLGSPAADSAPGSSGDGSRTSAGRPGGALRENSGQASPAPTTQSNRDAQQRDDSTQQAQLAAYAAFEKAANDDLERSVGSAIERTLKQALPALASAGRASGVGAQHSFAHAQDKAAPLQARLTAAIRQDVEKALQGDRQLGEQVAQILAGKRLDSETRAQVVRLIAERAQQLIPVATKRALNDWTQTTLATHRGKSERADAASTRREVAPAAPLLRPGQEHSAKRRDANRSAEADASSSARGRVNYRKLSDEQILDL